MEFVAQSLQGHGFDVRTADWPRVRVVLGDREFVIGTGATLMNTNALRVALARAMEIAEGPK